LIWSWSARGSEAGSIDSIHSTTYAAHCWDVYDHYRWRYVLSKQGEAAFSALDTTDAWQDKYFSHPEIKNEIAFFTGAGVAAPDPVPA